jgi:hypothetical protein
MSDNENDILDLDEAKRDNIRSATKRQRKSRRHSWHDETRHQSIHRDKRCCEAWSQQIKDMPKYLFGMNAQLASLQIDYYEMKKVGKFSASFSKIYYLFLLFQNLFRKEKEKHALIKDKNRPARRLNKATLKKENSSKATQTANLLTTGISDNGVLLKDDEKENDSTLSNFVIVIILDKVLKLILFFDWLTGSDILQ